MADMSTIQERVRKLLALSASPNAAEAASAMEKCRELMDKYGIRTIDVDPIERTMSVHVRDVDTMTPNAWEKVLATKVAEAIGAKAYLLGGVKSNAVLKFIGGNSDIELAIDLFLTLRRTISIMGKKYAFKTGSGKLSMQSYCSGAVLSVYHNICKAYRTDNTDLMALVPVKETAIDDYVAQNMGKVKNQKAPGKLDTTAFYVGSIDGRSIGVHTKVLQG